MSNTVHGVRGTNISVHHSRPGEFQVQFTYTGSENAVRTVALSIENSQHLRLLLEEAEIEAAPKPSKADRIRQQAQPQGNDHSQTANARRLDNILAILDEDGPL